MAKEKTEVATIATPSTELILLQPELTAVAQNSGIELTKAEKYASGYAPLMSEVLQQAELLKPLDKTNPDDAAKAKRISLDLGKICSRLTAKKKEDKDTLLIETRLIDGLFNVAESTARLTQKEADEIVDYLAEIERKRLADLAETRRAELESYGADTSYLPLEVMGDEQYTRCLESAQLAFEARRVAAEKAEADRLAEIERVRLAEIEAARLQAERIEAERLEAIRVREELAAKEAELAKEREAARVAAEKLAKENAEKIAKTKRLADIENARLAKLAKETADKHAAELAKQKAAAEKLAKELQAKKDAEAKIEAERIAAEKAANIAPDKVKIRAFYDTIKAIQIPEFKSKEANVIGEYAKLSITQLLSEIVKRSKEL